MTTRRAGPVGWLYAQPAVLLTFTALFWAGNAIAGQLAVGEIAPFQLVLMRWVLVSAVLLPLFRDDIRAHWEIVRPRLARTALMATLGFTVFNALFYIASHRTSGVNIGILQGSIPVFVLLMAFVAHRAKVRPAQGAGVAITLAGVVLVATSGDPIRALSLGLNSGDLLMLTACACYAFYTVQLRDRPQMPGGAFFALMCPIAALTSLPFTVGEWVVEAPGLPTLNGWLVTLYVAIFPSCVAQLFFLRGVDLIGPGAAGVFVNLVPIFAALLSVILLGQVFDWYHGVALVLVVSGIWLAQRGGR